MGKEMLTEKDKNMILAARTSSAKWVMPAIVVGVLLVIAVTLVGLWDKNSSKSAVLSRGLFNLAFGGFVIIIIMSTRRWLKIVDKLMQ